MNTTYHAHAGFVVVLGALFILSALSTFIFVARADAASTNLIPNPSFETVNGSMPENWTSTYWGMRPTFLYPVAGANGSAKAASVTLSRNSSGDARWQHDPVSVEAGTTYTYSNWYKSNVATEVDVVYTLANGTVSYAYVTGVPSSNNSWQQVQATITTPANATKASVYQILTKKGTLVVDEFVLIKEGDTPPPPPPPPTPDPEPTLSFSAAPSTITVGDTSNLSWSSTNASTCTASNGWSGAKSVSGNQNVVPSVTMTYALSCSGSGGAVQKEVTVMVNDAPIPPPPPPVPSAWQGMVTLSFDDAWRSQYTNALPILEAAGLKGTFYILTEGVKGGWSDYMTPSMVTALANAGQNVEGHTVTHKSLNTLTNTKIDKEIKDSKTYIESLTGTLVHSLAYPYGSYNTKVINRTKAAGYTNARTADPETQYGFNTENTPRYELNSFSPTTAVSVAEMKAAIDQAKSQKLWFIFSFHEIENGLSDEYATTIARFQEVIDYITVTGIPVVTIEEGQALLKN